VIRRLVARGMAAMVVDRGRGGRGDAVAGDEGTGLEHEACGHEHSQQQRCEQRA
jgi:hypothetical protein